MKFHPQAPSIPPNWQRRGLVVALAASPALPALAQFRVEVSGVGLTQLPIALVPFRGEDAAPQKISAIIRADLERTGQFRSVDPSGQAMDETTRPDMSVWRQRTADALAGGSVTRLGDGRYDVRFRLWDVVKGQDLGGQGYVVPQADLRLAAHKIADYIYEKLTGEKGVFSTRLAYVTKAGSRYTLWVADSDGENAQAALGSPEPIISPTWSPNSTQLAYVSFESRKPVIYVHDVASGRRRLLANIRGSNSAPAWSPDGGTIYFVSDRGGAPQIYRMSASGGAAQRVTFSGGYNVSPSVSPDGRYLAYVSRSAGYKLQVMELASGNVTAVTDTAEDENPSFAPNSRLIVYATRQGGREALMTTTVDGKIKARLAGRSGDIREPSWGPFQR